MDPQLFTAEQAATFLGMSERSFWKLVAAGRISAVRFSKRMVRFNRADLLKLCEASHATAPTTAR